MFSINVNPIETQLPVIVYNYKDLLFDEVPILYIGTNHYGNRIIGSLVDEDRSNKFTRFLHSIIDDNLYYDFISKKISYLELLKTNKERYIIDETYAGDRFIFPVSMDDIPLEFLPSNNSYCPDISHNSTFNYGISLKGKMADEHKGEVLDINSVQTDLEQIIKSALFQLDELNLDSKALLQPATTGSFRINFSIEFRNNIGLFPVENENLSNYISSYLDYVLLKLPNEDDAVLDFFPQSLFPVKEALNLIYRQTNSMPHDAIIEEALIENINTTAKKLVSLKNNIENSKSFDRIEIYNYENSGYEHSVGKIDSDYLQLIEPKLLKATPLLEHEEKEIDEEPKNYRILIYKLNSETGNGQARVYYDDSEKFDKVFMNIKTEKEINNSIYSNGFHEGKVISISGYATKINGAFKKLRIEY